MHLIMIPYSGKLWRALNLIAGNFGRRFSTWFIEIVYKIRSFLLARFNVGILHKIHGQLTKLNPGQSFPLYGIHSV